MGILSGKRPRDVMPLRTLYRVLLAGYNTDALTQTQSNIDTAPIYSLDEVGIGFKVSSVFFVQVQVYLW